MAETPKDDLPPHLAALSPKDLKGVMKRAKREGVPLEQVKLRDSDLAPDPDMDPEEQAEKDVLGIVARSRREKLPVDQLPLRDGDDFQQLRRTLNRVIRSAGLIVKSTGDGRPTGTLRATDVDKMIKEEKERAAGQKK